MSVLNDQYLLELNRQGFVPGPGEDDKVYLERVSRSMSSASSVDNIDYNLPFSAVNKVRHHEQEGGCEITRRLFDICPFWISAYYSNYALAPWHAATSWIITPENQNCTVSFVQLRNHFANKSRYLKLYHRDEVLAHEFTHICRSAFPKSKYEEIYAYQTAKTPLRRFLGPIIASVIETWLFVVSILLVLAIDVWFLLAPNFSLLPLVTAVQLLPWVVLMSLFGRLLFRQWRYNRCVTHLKNCLGNERKAFAVAYRLIDDEIALFAKKHINIRKYVAEHKETSLRWKVLSLSYF